MAWCQHIATDYKDCLEQVKDFCTKAFAAGAVTHVVGSYGQVYGASATEISVAETWTLTCTTGGTNGTAKFSVSSPSEVATYPDATAGVPYSQAKVSFIITADPVSPANDFAVNDQFTFAIAASTAEWVVDRWDIDYHDTIADQYELIMHGIGDGADAIYIGINTKTDESTYWNWLVTGLTGYVGANPMTAQPGYYPFYDCMNTGSAFPFTCIMTSRHIKVIANIDYSYDCSSYVGWMLPHATPSQWQYPMFCGGSTPSESEVIDSGVDAHTCYWNAFSDKYTGAVLDMSTWKEINRYSPRHFGDFDEWRPGAIDDLMRLYPAVPIGVGPEQVFGALEGVYYPTPYVPGTGLLTAGSVIITDDVTALCFKDVDRAGAGNIVAMDLMGDI